MNVTIKENSEPSQFFAQIKKLTSEFVEKGAGKIALNIQSRPLEKGKKEIKIYAPNLMVPSFRNFSSENLISYLSQSPTDEQAFNILKEGLLDIVNASSYGQVTIIFRKNKKKEIILFSELTISRKHTVSSVQI